MASFIFIHFNFSRIYGAPPSVDVSPERIILLENKPLEVVCRVGVPITYCRFAVPGVSSALNLRPSIPAHEGIEYFGAGLDKGECGMLIRNVNPKHSGIIQCTMGFTDEPTESIGNLTLIVAKAPDPPLLFVSPSSTYGNSYLEGETIQATCKISNARPIANISWYLGTEPIYDRLSPTITEEENGLMSISQNLSRQITYADHNKDLKCVAGHIALGPGTINHSIFKLNIKFPPKPKSQELEKFGFTIGQPGKIIVTFQANPIPDIIWKVDQDSLKPGTRDRTGRFEAGILQHKGAGTWDATLIINTVRAEEVEKRYTLIAQNELGRETYKVAISTSPEPPTNITAGAIVGIVVAVLVILLLIFMLIFARATGRWCFAAGTNGKKSSSEVAIEDENEEKRPPSIQGKDGVYSSTEYINGNDGKKITDKINTPV
ncbi:Fasciclin-3 precursor, putative [Pediculus humanus corporis]|uniref:Fasciclin-3, putative n=1 Tax=Pediculus humanus subsp. corporis TaxID=121224 RepID=E0W2N4_PEDHC|nr:Fasciclin-3 precursor, putative [Pediculus humanus corporis]EEB19890.1 Fasciclin-3 precursor, putative [Pediculus humanus corporis]